MAPILASFPSPPINSFHIGPLRVTFYGIFIAIGVAVAWQIAERRFVARRGDREVLGRILARVLIFGFLGARLGYVSTHLSRFEWEWWKVIAVWEGGLALYGGLTAGAIAFFVYARKWKANTPDLLDSLAPALPAAQAIGRWGNYFNQELFGTPTDLPWGVEIDPAHRPEAYPDATAFHPTFLYESLWNIGLAFLIVWLDKRYPQPKGRLIGVYFIGYGLMRFLLELIRTDTTFRLVGLSRNGWVSIGAMFVGAAVIAWPRKAATVTDEASV